MRYIRARPFFRIGFALLALPYSLFCGLLIFLQASSTTLYNTKVNCTAYNAKIQFLLKFFILLLNYLQSYSIKYKFYFVYKNNSIKYQPCQQ